MRNLFRLILVAAILVTGLVAIRPVSASGDLPPVEGDLVLKNISGSASFDRAWTWQINKKGSTSSLILSPGQTATVDYGVTVTGVSQNTNAVVNGTLGFANRRTTDVTITSVVVNIAGVQITPTCQTPPGYPPVLHPGYTVTCTYSAVLPQIPDGTSLTSVATITASDGTVVSASLDIPLTGPINETGKCINVDDSLAGYLGQVCGSANPTAFTFNYTHTVGPFNTCGLYTVDNTATIRETGASASWAVKVDVPCAGGCTLTQGYWKTHSRLGPAPYDAAWQNLGGLQEQTTFFLSGATWYNVFWTAPKGNPYYILAHQYMAAKLNTLDGAAATPAVSAALAWAETFFAANTPATTFSKSLKNEITSNAGILDSFNNGLTGPGHCSE